MYMFNSERQNFLSGRHFQKTHQQSVNAILGYEKQVPVRSFGNEFYNQGNWPGRKLVAKACEWASKNPGCIPTPNTIHKWCYEANQRDVRDHMIVIAQTPAKLAENVAAALMGGAYHEAWHSLYSRCTTITRHEAKKLILPRWALVKDWSKWSKELQTWNNVVEDIRIERLGCKEFPGTPGRMADLQDFILQKEHEHRMKKPNALSIIMMTFRDLGLGYNTRSQIAALKYYQAVNPVAFHLVFDGPLRPLLDRAKNLTRQDDLACFEIAFEVIAIIEQMMQGEGEGNQDGDDDQNKDQNEGDDEGQGQGGEQSCPKCGSEKFSWHTPYVDEHGKKDHKKGVITCKDCGHQVVADLNDKPSQGSGSSQMENDSNQDQNEDQGQGDGQSQQSDDAGDQNSSGGSGGQSDQEGSEEGESSDSSDSKGGNSEKGENPLKGKKPKSATGEEHMNDPTGKSSNQGQQNNDQVASGGNTGGDSRTLAELMQQLEDELKDGQQSDLMDMSSALEDEIEGSKEREVKKDGKVKRGEAPYRPFTTMHDNVSIVQTNDYAAIQADNLEEKVREYSLYLRSRMQKIIRAAEVTDVSHGHKKGKRLSGRYLTNTMISMKSGKIPKKPFQSKQEKLDTSMSACVVIDESASMSARQELATQVLMAICQPLDDINVPVEAIGFRDGISHPDVPTRKGLSQGCHRVNGIQIDVFKRFNEKYSAVKARFAQTRASGCTPMADGIQYGLEALSTRLEGHRVLFIITDGCPDTRHEPVVKRQIRIANESGIHVIGVGIGSGASYVETLFPDSVYSWDMDELPKLLIQKLNELIDFRAQGRGKKLKSTG